MNEQKFIWIEADTTKTRKFKKLNSYILDLIEVTEFWLPGQIKNAVQEFNKWNKTSLTNDRHYVGKDIIIIKL